MDAEVDAVLGQLLADLGRDAGSIGGAAGGAVSGVAGAGRAGGIGGGRGGSRGAAWAARRLKTETAVDTRYFDPSQTPAVLVALSQALHAQLDPPGRASDGTVVLRGVVGSGVAGLNPAYVIAVVEAAVGQVSIAAHAKEGLIKQHTAQKAVRQLLATLSDS
jgi:hypothetical protein